MICDSENCCEGNFFKNDVLKFCVTCGQSKVHFECLYNRDAIERLDDDIRSMLENTITYTCKICLSVVKMIKEVEKNGFNYTTLRNKFLMTGLVSKFTQQLITLFNECQPDENIEIREEIVEENKIIENANDVNKDKDDEEAISSAIAKNDEVDKTTVNINTENFFEALSDSKSMSGDENTGKKRKKRKKRFKKVTDENKGIQILTDEFNIQSEEIIQDEINQDKFMDGTPDVGRPPEVKYIEGDEIKDNPTSDYFSSNEKHNQRNGNDVKCDEPINGLKIILKRENRSFEDILKTIVKYYDGNILIEIE